MKSMLILVTFDVSGKIEVAAVRGEKIPTGWAVNGEGKNTNDPRC